MVCSTILTSCKSENYFSQYGPRLEFANEKNLNKIGRWKRYRVKYLNISHFFPEVCGGRRWRQNVSTSYHSEAMSKQLLTAFPHTHISQS